MQKTRPGRSGEERKRASPASSARLARSDVESTVAAAIDSGDYTTAATVAIREYGPELVSFFHAVLRDETEAEECFGDLCEALWRGLPGFRRDCSLRTWCYILSRHILARHFRTSHKRRARQMALSQVPEGLHRLAVRVRTSTLGYLRTEAKDRFARLREKLTPEQQMLLILRVDRNLSWDQIAHILTDGDIPDEQRLKRKAAALRKQFQRTKETLSRLARREGFLAKERETE